MSTTTNYMSAWRTDWRPIRRHKVGPADRKALARRYGLTGPGQEGSAPCAYCGVLGKIKWIGAWTRPAGFSFDRPRRMPATVYFEHHIEHVVPVVAGGRTMVDNLTLACPPCNYRKGTCIDGSWRAH